MAFRTLVISTSSKLELKLNYLIFRTKDDIKRIFLDEVHTVIVQSTAVAVTSALLCELCSRGIKVVFCDSKNNPCSELVSYYNHHNSPKIIKDQMEWNLKYTPYIWKNIIENKIYNQMRVLKKHDKEEYLLLEEYFKDVKNDDITNREGHAAKVYFNCLFYEGFTRSDDCYINMALNYGYAILLSQINREIVSYGYLTQLGIHHKNEYNFFNLSCDLMEPFRPIIDDKVKELSDTSDIKKEMQDLFNITVIIDNSKQTFVNAIKIYVLSVLRAIGEENVKLIKNYTNYEI
ncbi:MAG: type II CRISPR-associated endonuclease Cas1 [Bacilli bacterium]|nr:type II CRISPR-associated endonuclease Cas1 [Bacilli bacterium]